MNLKRRKQNTQKTNVRSSGLVTIPYHRRISTTASEGAFPCAVSNIINTPCLQRLRTTVHAAVSPPSVPTISTRTQQEQQLIAAPYSLVNNNRADTHTGHRGRNTITLTSNRRRCSSRSRRFLLGYVNPYTLQVSLVVTHYVCKDLFRNVCHLSFPTCYARVCCAHDKQVNTDRPPACKSRPFGLEVSVVCATPAEFKHSPGNS